MLAGAQQRSARMVALLWLCFTLLQPSALAAPTSIEIAAGVTMPTVSNGFIAGIYSKGQNATAQTIAAFQTWIANGGRGVDTAFECELFEERCPIEYEFDVNPENADISNGICTNSSSEVRTCSSAYSALSKGLSVIMIALSLYISV